MDLISKWNRKNIKNNILNYVTKLTHVEGCRTLEISKDPFQFLYCVVQLRSVLTRSGGTAQEEHKYPFLGNVLLVRL